MSLANNPTYGRYIASQTNISTSSQGSQATKGSKEETKSKGLIATAPSTTNIEKSEEARSEK